MPVEKASESELTAGGLQQNMPHGPLGSSWRLEHPKPTRSGSKRLCGDDFTSLWDKKLLEQNIFRLVVLVRVSCAAVDFI